MPMTPDTDAMERHLGETFLGIVSDCLAGHPEGLSEHALLGLLREAGHLDFGPGGDALHGLFRDHFLLFHALYRLRDRAWAERRATLEIGPLRIRWLPYLEGENAVGAPDPLREYYLDPANLRATSAGDVADLLSAFWTRLGRRERRAEALAQLGLADPVDDAAIRRAYRRLAMAHHPDRGGDDARLQAINAAAAVLLKGR